MESSIIECAGIYKLWIQFYFHISLQPTASWPIGLKYHTARSFMFCKQIMWCQNWYHWCIHHWESKALEISQEPILIMIFLPKIQNSFCSLPFCNEPIITNLAHDIIAMLSGHDNFFNNILARKWIRVKYFFIKFAFPTGREFFYTEVWTLLQYKDAVLSVQEIPLWR